MLGEGVRIDGLDGLYNHYQVYDSGGSLTYLYVQQTIEIMAHSGG
jgi:hypothetical protein